MSRQNVMDLEQAEREIIAMKQNNCSIGQMVRRSGRSYSFVRSVCLRHGFSFHKPRFNWNEDNTAKMIFYWEIYKDYDMVADMMGAKDRFVILNKIKSLRHDGVNISYKRIINKRTHYENITAQGCTSAHGHRRINR